MSNYDLIQYFINMIGEFAISNPDKDIDKNFIYSQLMGFNIKNEQLPYYSISHEFENWKARYNNNPNINAFEVDKRPFLWFTNGKMRGNEVKLYIPMDYNHIKEGANQLFDFLINSGIEHQSKIADKIRNDNLVVRVNSLEDAEKIIKFVKNNDYIQEGLIKTNPFLTNFNGVGLAMDNNYSYNSTICQILSNFINYLKKYNRFDLLTVDNLNQYIKNSIPNIQDLDLKDIYTLLSKTTDKNFKLQDFINHADNKLIDSYAKDRKRITDPKYYLEEAIKITKKTHPKNCEIAILEYLKGNSNYFTNTNRVRDGLIKYVHPGDLINIMRTKLSENNINIPNSDKELINTYINLVLSDVYKKQFNIICSAYNNTEIAYDQNQAVAAIRDLIVNNSVKYFTNRFNDRTNLNNFVVGHDVKRILLSQIDIQNLDIENTEEIINRFLNKLEVNDNNIEKKQKT